MHEETSVPAIDSLLRTLVSAWNTRDLEQYSSNWADDADFVNVLGIRHKSREAHLKELRFIHSDLLAGSQMRDEEHSVRLLTDDVAVVHMHWEMTKVPYRARFCETGVRHGVLTHVLQKRDGTWRIIASQNTDVVDPSHILPAPSGSR